MSVDSSLIELDTPIGEVGRVLLMGRPVKVEMLFGHAPDVFREVVLAMDFWDNHDLTVADVLEGAFHYGQNDFQPIDDRCSVSVGDVVHLFGALFRVENVGFRKLELAEYLDLCEDSRKQNFLC